MPIRIPIISPIGKGPKGDKGDPGEATEELLRHVEELVDSTVREYGDSIDAMLGQLSSDKDSLKAEIINIKQQAESDFSKLRTDAETAVERAIEASDSANSAMATINEGVKNIEEHGFAADNGSLSIEHGGTGGTSSALARQNLSVYSKAEIDEKIKTVNSSTDSKIKTAKSSLDKDVNDVKSSLTTTKKDIEASMRSMMSDITSTKSTVRQLQTDINRLKQILGVK